MLPRTWPLCRSCMADGTAVKRIHSAATDAATSELPGVCNDTGGFLLFADILKSDQCQREPPGPDTSGRADPPKGRQRQVGVTQQMKNLPASRIRSR